MTRYIDSSALVKRYVDEPGSDAGRRLLLEDPDWVTANHTITEVVRTLHRVLDERSFEEARDALERDWGRTIVVALDDSLCRRAGVLATLTGARTLDALHLAAAERVGGRSLAFLTFDVRQAAAARTLGLPVIGG